MQQARTRSSPSRLAAAWRRLRAQFVGLDTRNPASWPLAPRMVLYIGLAVSLVVALWFGLIASSAEALNELQAQETRLKADYTRKVAQTVNLPALRRQREQVQGYVNQLEKQLPGRAEMDALLSDINQAGLGRSLVFDLFRPGQIIVRDYYAELPIALKVAGRYHDMGAFAADIANLSRIVTLNNISIVPARDGTLVMEATAKTFRYLDPEEIAAQRRAAQPGSAPAGGPRR